MDLNSAFDQQPCDKVLGPVILLVDDQEADRLLFRTRCLDAIQAQGFHFMECSGIAEAIQVLLKTDVHVIVLDKDLGKDKEDPRHDGIASIPELLLIRPNAQILMLTGNDNRQNIVQAMRNGAFGYVLKGDGKDLLLEQLKNAVRYSSLVLMSTRLAVQRGQQESKGLDFPGSSEAIQGLRRQVDVISKSDAAALMLGESGTGKSVAALIGHNLRQQHLKQNGSFVQLNMSAVPENLAERELFGHDRGAFTGAVDSKIGLVEAADGGTLFLDEIGDASLDLQAKLLTVLDKKEFRRVGSSQIRRSHFRLICATNKDLQQLIREKKFREDLFYRISVITIHVPSLTERREDIPEIVRSVLPKCCDLAGIYVHFDDIPNGFIQYLMDNIPDGNLRGIENQLVQLLLMSDRDKNDVPILSQWKKMLKTQKVQLREIQGLENSLTLPEIMSRPLDVVGHAEFQGFSKFVEAIARRVVLDARKKFSKNSEIAKALEVSEGFVSMRLKELGMSQRQLRKASQPSTESAE
ncbi:sigma 54-interacting transcriptional regulator [Bdellovibrionota bacterium FG-1]